MTDGINTLSPPNSRGRAIRWRLTNPRVPRSPLSLPQIIDGVESFHLHLRGDMEVSKEPNTGGEESISDKNSSHDGWVAGLPCAPAPSWLLLVSQTLIDTTIHTVAFIYEHPVVVCGSRWPTIDNLSSIQASPFR